MSYKKATFAGGCFWCMVEPFDELPGIIDVLSGYTGGHVKKPTYKQVKQGMSGHYEAVQIIYDPDVFSYQKLLDLYWPQIDPTDDGGQFIDRGSQYRTAIFYEDEEQKQLAEQSLLKVEEKGPFTSPIVTKILPLSTFYSAESEHQSFYKKNPEKYKQEREDSGRDQFIHSHWS
ncbi:peptide-methionine (S)-S-oxide reductase MsrA [Salipaludibacillus daqingensis]|uniref:peptide-methionine (S)-S-oxide reductase MsrA n=1 Tax=Salipaludibacillus daqingensis TaxID=3041001 RepID=UPI002476EA2A|nr:peptide-methionine (S)-S-oxide reductase MsrA [Salipaludibacillus daqingensis]